MDDENSESLVLKHDACPFCGYDWYLSMKGVCSECGLQNGGLLYDEYVKGRRPAPLEYPVRSYMWATVRTLRSRHLFTNLARHFPPEEARSFYTLVHIFVFGLYVAITFLCKALNLANDDDLAGVVFAGFGSAAPPSLVFPNAQDFSHALLWSTVYGASIMLALYLIRRRCLMRFASLAGLTEGDSERLFAYASPWLAMLLLSWHGSQLACVAALKIVPHPLIAGVTWLLILGVGLSGWQRSLFWGVKSLSGDSAGQRAAATSSRACMLESIIIVLCCHVVLVEGLVEALARVRPAGLLA